MSVQRMIVLPPPAPTSVAEEIGAMSAVSDVFSRIDEDAQLRVATWLFDRYAAPRLARKGN